jgi:transposase
MSTQRQGDSAEFKARVAWEAITGHKTVNEFARTSGVHPTPITPWKHQRQQEVPHMFSARRAQRAHDQEALQAQLYQQIGPLKGEWDGVKKKWEGAPEARRSVLAPDHPQISVARPGARVGGSRSRFDEGSTAERLENLPCMRVFAAQ